MRDDFDEVPYDEDFEEEKTCLFCGTTALIVCETAPIDYCYEGSPCDAYP